MSHRAANPARKTAENGAQLAGIIQKYGWGFAADHSVFQFDRAELAEALRLLGGPRLPASRSRSVLLAALAVVA